MKNFILSLLLTVSPLFLFAHNPLSARYYFEAGESVSLLSISLSQDGINQTLLKKYSNTTLDAMSKKEFEELIVDYVKSNFSFSFDGQEVILGEGGIKLGSHQTDLKFVLPPVAKQLEQVDVNIPAFKENKNHQSIFSYSINGKQDHVILSTHNNYKSTLLLRQASTTENSWLWFIGIGIGCLIVMIAAKFYKTHVIKKGLKETLVIA